jgi:hypothetical protein
MWTDLSALFIDAQGLRGEDGPSDLPVAHHAMSHSKNTMSCEVLRWQQRAESCEQDAMRQFITRQQPFLIATLIAAAVCISFAFVTQPSRWLTSAAALMGLAALVQTIVSTIYRENSDHFWNPEKYPNGPPSFWMRNVTMDDSPSWHARTRRALFYNSDVGFGLAVLGAALAIAAAWL